MRQYELMVILDPELDERTVAPSLDKFLSVVTKDGLAEDLGFKSGDKLISAGGRAVASVAEFKQILKSKGVEQIEEIRIDTDPAARNTMMEITGRRTVPQIFIGDTHVGGHDDLVALDGRGGLMPLLGAQ